MNSLNVGDMIYLDKRVPSVWWNKKTAFVVTVGDACDTHPQENPTIELAVVDAGVIKTLYSCLIYLKDCTVSKRKRNSNG